jgi:hypothetical protein
MFHSLSVYEFSQSVFFYEITFYFVILMSKYNVTPQLVKKFPFGVISNGLKFLALTPMIYARIFLSKTKN